MTIQTRRRSVDGHGRRGAGCPLVAACAVARPKGVARSGIGRSQRRFTRALVGEGVAAHAVGMHTRAEALLRQPCCVIDGGSGRVTGGTARRGHRAHACPVELVAGFAGDPLLLDMYEVPGDAPIATPLSLHIDPSTRRPAAAFA